MIKFENTVVSGWEAAIRGMRNPMNSWDKSDSHYLISNDNRHGEFVIGDNDLTLMKQLVSAGSDHSKFMRMINVTVDITAPMYWWAEADTYKVGTVRNSCSKMHKLLDRPFEMNDFSFDKLMGYRNEMKQFRPSFDEKDEIWKPLNPFYSVSNFGIIKIVSCLVVFIMMAIYLSLLMENSSLCTDLLPLSSAMVMKKVKSSITLTVTK